jgi:hypothetical protein
MRLVAVVVSLVAFAPPVSAQWSRVTEVPPGVMFSVWVNGDTIAASSESTVYVSTNAGVTWKGSSTVVSGATEIERVMVRNGRVYAGTRGEGFFVSDDLGDTWADFNQGLVGGFANSQLNTMDMLVRRDSLYLATDGDGAWVRDLRGGSWSRFGASTLASFSAQSMNMIAASDSRLLAGGGFNGTAFFRDPGQADWTLTPLGNDRFLPGLAVLAGLWTGDRWLVGTNVGVFSSTTGEPPWTETEIGSPPWFFVSFARHGQDIFGDFEANSSEIQVSHDDGLTWELFESFPGIPVIHMATAGDELYAARADGLWRRSLAAVSAPPRQPSSLRFALATSQPVLDDARLAFDVPEAGHAVIEVFNLAGRRTSVVLDAPVPAGRHEVAWITRDLPSGIYYARLRIGSQAETLRLVRVR